MRITGKTKLVRIISEKPGASKNQVADFVDVFDVITEKQVTGEKNQLIGFGAFMARTREASMGRNPGTGEPIKISAQVVAVFKPGKRLKESEKMIFKPVSTIELKAETANQSAVSQLLSYIARLGRTSLAIKR